MHHYMLGAAQIKSSLEEKRLAWDPGDAQVKHMPVKYPVREEILGCIRQIAAIPLRGVNPACYSAVESPYLEYFP